MSRRKCGLSVTPAEAERVTSGIGVNLKALGRAYVFSRLQEPGAEGHDLVMGSPGVIDEEVEMHLLR